jgi:hypothetical protein
VKVKFFVMEGPLTGPGAKLEEFEAALNEWLGARPNARVEHVHQVVAGGALDSPKVVVSVWYREHAEPGAAPDRGGT